MVSVGSSQFRALFLPSGVAFDAVEARCFMLFLWFARGVFHKAYQLDMYPLFMEKGEC